MGITSEAVVYLSELPWPGNVRELQGVVEAATAVASGVITLPDVREVVRRREQLDALWTPAPPPSAMPLPPQPATELAHTNGIECERVVFGSLTYRELTGRYFDYLLQLTGGRLTEVARRAGIAKATAFEWRKRFKNGGQHDGPD
jgi:DNA-binding NtrC family response regulator